MVHRALLDRRPRDGHSVIGSPRSSAPALRPGHRVCSPGQVPRVLRERGTRPTPCRVPWHSTSALPPCPWTCPQAPRGAPKRDIRGVTTTTTQHIQQNEGTNIKDKNGAGLTSASSEGQSRAFWTSVTLASASQHRLDPSREALDMGQERGTGLLHAWDRPLTRLLLGSLTAGPCLRLWLPGTSQSIVLPGATAGSKASPVLAQSRGVSCVLFRNRTCPGQERPPEKAGVW